jgi:hypothetical protein
VAAAAAAVAAAAVAALAAAVAAGGGGCFQINGVYSLAYARVSIVEMTLNIWY